MASIRKRGETYQARVRVRGFSPTTRTFVIRKDAKQWAKETEAAMLRGAWLDRTEAEETSLREALARYEREITPTKKGAIAERNVIAQINRHISLANQSLATIKATDIVRLRDELALKGFAPATIARRLAVISHLFTVATKEWGMTCLTNPVLLVRKPVVRNARTRRLSPVEQKYLLPACDRHAGGWLRAVVDLALETAMRRGEIAGLQWNWIDLAKRTVRLPDTKNGTARAVPLSTKAGVVLNATIRRIRDSRVFPVASGDAITAAFDVAVRRARAAYEADKGREGVTPTALQEDRTLIDLRLHDLRHEAVSRLFERGLNPMEVASISGHRTLSMLQRYTHLAAEDLARKLG